jgi:amino acid transporter
MRRLVELVVVLDMIAVLIGTAVAASRGIFSLARDERLPRPLASISRRGTPTGASNVVLLSYVVLIYLALKTAAFAIPGLPEYVSVFSWMSTYGGFALTVIYFMLAIGAIRGLRDHGSQGKLWGAIVVGGLVSGAAIFGGLYKVAKPTVWAPEAAVAILVLGVLVSFVLKTPETGQPDFSNLRDSEQGPQKV